MCRRLVLGGDSTSGVHIGRTMARRSYFSFNKRAKEQKKKKKAEGKRARRLAKKVGEDGAADLGVSGVDPERSDVDPGTAAVDSDAPKAGDKQDEK
jgi:hypothetical protein